jgi:hypothetical protein
MLPNASGDICPSARYKQIAEIKIITNVIKIANINSYLLSIITLPIRISPDACLLVFNKENNLRILNNLSKNDSLFVGSPAIESKRNGAKAIRSIIA